MARKTNRRKTRSLRNTYLIIVDGQTEQWYFNAIKAAHPSLPFNVKPELPSKKKITEQAKFVQEKIDEGYGKVFWLVDLDHVLHHNQFDTFKRHALKIRRKNPAEKIQILVNNPCLELWFLLHFKYTDRIFSRCNELIVMLKEHIENYEKSRKFYLKYHSNIYEELKDRTRIALERAKRLGDFDWNNPRRTVAEIYKLMEILLHANS